MANIQQEIWKPIQGYEGIYEISSLGRIKSLERRDCRGQYRAERIIKLANDKDGYKILTLAKDRVNSSKRVHRLVAEAFIKNPNNLPQVNHINGLKWDNNVSNLEWCDHMGNVIHAVNTGLRSAKGEKNNGCVLTESQVLEIYNSTGTNKEISKRYNVGELAINRIKIGKTWGHLTGHVYKQKRSSTFLDSETVLSIFNNPKTPLELSKEIGYPQGVIAMIKRGQTYSRITGKMHVVNKRKHTKI